MTNTQDMKSIEDFKDLFLQKLDSSFVFINKINPIAKEVSEKKTSFSKESPSFFSGSENKNKEEKEEAVENMQLEKQIMYAYELDKEISKSQKAGINIEDRSNFKLFLKGQMEKIESFHDFVKFLVRVVATIYEDTIVNNSAEKNAYKPIETVKKSLEKCLSDYDKLNNLIQTLIERMEYLSYDFYADASHCTQNLCAEMEYFLINGSLQESYRDSIFDKDKSIRKNNFYTIHAHKFSPSEPFIVSKGYIIRGESSIDKNNILDYARQFIDSVLPAEQKHHI